MERGHIDLGVFPPLGSFQLTSLIADFQRNFPGVKLSFYEAECEELIGMLLDSKINLAFLSEIEGAPVNFHNLLVDEIGLIVNSFHPLAVQQSVSLSELANESFIIPTPTSGIYKNFVAACNENGFIPRLSITATRSIQMSAWCRLIWVSASCPTGRHCATPTRLRYCALCPRDTKNFVGLSEKCKTFPRCQRIY